MKYESDLKHTTIAKVRAEDKEKKSRGELRVAEDELRSGMSCRWPGTSYTWSEMSCASKP